MRRVVTLAALILGLGLAAVSYLFLAAPLGQPTDESYSNPRLDFAPLLFIVGVILACSSPVLYELWPDRESDARDEQTDADLAGAGR